MRKALVSLLVMILVAAGLLLGLASWTNIGRTWAVVISVGIGYVASELLVGGPFVHRD